VLHGLPHLTYTEYLRDFFFGTLAGFCSGSCPLCGGLLAILGLRLRKTLDLPLFRSQCRGCRTRFTFLPRFVAPGKWFAYPQIEQALTFVAQAGFSSVSQGLREWDYRRDRRIDSGLSAGPSASSVRRWWMTLSQRDQAEFWSERGRDALSAGLGPSPEMRNAGGPEPAGHGSAGLRLLTILRLLGEFLLGSFRASCHRSWFGAALWALESQVGRRCLADADLVGTLIPSHSPYLAVTATSPRGYPPEPSRPP
jgi:hypothetical protein